MAKHLSAMTRNGYSFGMDVDSKLANTAMKKARRIKTMTSYGYEHSELVIDMPWVASMMCETAWLVTELHDFVTIQIEDSPRYRVIYPEKGSDHDQT